MISFQNPYGLLLILLIPLLFLLRKIGFFKQITFKAVFADWNGNSFLWKEKLQKFLTVFSKIAAILGFCLCVISFADPVISEQEKIFTTLGTDTVFVLDTSPSMAAKDINTENGISRLEASKNSIFTLLQKNQGARFGVVALGSNASVLVPLTIDFSFLTEQINKIKIGELGNGSAIGDGICTAVFHLASSSAPKKCIILLTDGENNAGEIHPETGAKLAAENGISLYVVGIGSKGNVPIEYTDPATGKNYSGYLDSDFDSSSLKKIAQIGGGRYFESKTLENLNEILQNVTKTESAAQNFTYRITTIRLYKKISAIVIILFLLIFIIKMLILKEFICIKYKKTFAKKGFFIFLSFIFVILAFLGISWGTKLEPVQKTGNCVSMVFDISNSMMAKDCPENSTRLYAASFYAKKLLSKMPNSMVSVVLAKGDGVLAVPVTQDFNIIESLLDVLSPSFMTAPGTSLGKGILKAKESLNNKNFAGQILVFTDCEETDGELQKSLEFCAKDGIPVTIIGFGDEKKSKILAGDGKTVIETALRQKEIELLITKINEKLKILRNKTKISYINSAKKGSATEIIAEKENFVTTYEAKPVLRFKFFLFLAITAFSLSFILTEFNFNIFSEKKSNKNAAKTSFLLILMIFLFTAETFTSCSSDTVKIFKGTNYYQQKKFQKAVKCFVEVAENPAEKNQKSQAYAIYNLGTTYSMLGEDEIALEKFLQVKNDAPENVKYAAFYNAGIIYYKNGDFENASEYFKKAIQTDNSKEDAKINMEISMKMIQAKTHQNQANAFLASQNQNKENELKDKIFKHIRENDKKQWKNSETNQIQDLATDY